MLRTITEDVTEIATGFILFSSLFVLSTIVTLESRENLRKKEHRSGQIFFVRKASIGAPDATM